MAEIREIALDAAIKVWSAEYDPAQTPSVDLRRILHIADTFVAWLDRPNPAASLSLAASEPRLIPKGAL